MDLKSFSFFKVSIYSSKFSSYPSFYCILEFFICDIFIFISLKIFSNFLCDFLFDPLAVDALFNFQKFVNFPVFLLLSISSFIAVAEISSPNDREQKSEYGHALFKLYIKLVFC